MAHELYTAFCCAPNKSLFYQAAMTRLTIFNFLIEMVGRLIDLPAIDIKDTI